MSTLTLIAAALVLWGVLTLAIAYLRPKAIWRMGKIQGFVQLLGERGAVVFFTIVGFGAIVGGVLIMILR